MKSIKCNQKYLMISSVLTIMLLLSCEISAPKLEFDLNQTESAKFVWSDRNEIYLRQLNEAYKLDSLVNGIDEDFEKVGIICHWVHNLWEHDGINEPQKSDPASIIRQALEGQKFRCVEYSIVIQGCLTALGIQSRIVVLMREDVETVDKWGSHYVVEAYLNDLEKWCMVDGQWDAIPVRDGTPLDAVEFQQTLAREKYSVSLVKKTPNISNRYFQWIIPSLFYFQYYLDNRVDGTERSEEKIILVPNGANHPKVFQVKWPIDHATYTNAVQLVYPKSDMPCVSALDK